MIKRGQLFIIGGYNMKRIFLILLTLSVFVFTAKITPAGAGDLLPKPELEFLFEIIASLDPPQELGKTKYGIRRIINITGGTVAGPKINGKVLPGGADWQTVREDGTAEWLVADVTEEDEQQVFELTEQGHSVREIASKTGISKTQVNRIQQQGRERGLISK